MATAYYAEYITLGGVLCGSRAIHCYDHTDLLGWPDKDGSDWVVPGVEGVKAVPRGNRGMRAQLLFEINGKWDQDNAAITPASWRSNLYTLLAVVRPVIETKTTQTLQLTHPDGPTSAPVIVDRATPPRFETPEIVKFRVDVVVPAGALL